MDRHAFAPALRQLGKKRIADWKSATGPAAKIAMMKDGTTHPASKPERAVGLAPSHDEPCALAADNGYHPRDQLKALDGGIRKTRIAKPEPAGATRAGMA